MGKLTDIQIRHWIKVGQLLAKAQGEIPRLFALPYPTMPLLICFLFCLGIAGEQRSAFK
jgi:hypothetical protein